MQLVQEQIGSVDFLQTTPQYRNPIARCNPACWTEDRERTEVDGKINRFVIRYLNDWNRAEEEKVKSLDQAKGKPKTNGETTFTYKGTSYGTYWKLKAYFIFYLQVWQTNFLAYILLRRLGHFSGVHCSTEYNTWLNKSIPSHCLNKLLFSFTTKISLAYEQRNDSFLIKNANSSVLSAVTLR